jgi:hypothetical protein
MMRIEEVAFMVGGPTWQTAITSARATARKRALMFVVVERVVFKRIFWRFGSQFLLYKMC